MGRRQQHKHQLGDFWLDKRPGSDCWYIFWTDKSKGRVKRRSTGTTSLSEAKEALDDHYVANRSITDARPNEIGIGIILNRYYDEHGKNVASAHAIRNTISYMEEEWAELSVADLTIDVQKAFVKVMAKQGRSSTTIKRMFGVLGTALRYANQNGKLAMVPAVLKPDVFGQDNERNRVLSLQEMADIWDQSMPEHVRTFIVLAINTVARPGAIYDLRSRQIDLQNRLIDLNPHNRKQNKKFRPTVPITDTLLPWLNMERDYQVEYRGGPVKDIKNAWQTIREAAGLDNDDVVIYTIRHTMATELRKRGVPEWECKGIMGHKSGGVTERYAKYAPDHLDKAVQAIDDYCAELNKLTVRPVVLGKVTSIKRKRA